jgi:hypothetical protein
VGKHKVPFFAAKEGAGVTFTPFRQNNRDMEFGSWLEYLNTVVCAIYQVDPSEIGLRGFSSGGDGGGGPKIDSDAQATKIRNAKDKGFQPLMTFIAEQFNRHLLAFIAPEFEFQWVGLDPEDEDAKIEAAKARLEAGITIPVIEQKAMDIDIEALTPEGTDISWIYKPVNQVASQYLQTAQQAQAQQDQGAQQHQQALEQQAQTHGQAKELEQMKHQNAKELAQSQHGQKIEQQVVQAQAQGANQAAQDERKQGLAQQQHGHKLEQQAQVHEQTKDQMDKQGELDEQGAQTQHGRDLETLAAQQAHETQQGDLEREHDATQRGEDRKAKAAEPKPKGRKLSKGITIEILA